MKLALKYTLYKLLVYCISNNMISLNNLIYDKKIKEKTFAIRKHHNSSAVKQNHLTFISIHYHDLKTLNTQHEVLE